LITVMPDTDRSCTIFVGTIGVPFFSVSLE
jgi:hypothetical protein